MLIHAYEMKLQQIYHKTQSLLLMHAKMVAADKAIMQTVSSIGHWDPLGQTNST